MGPRAQGGPPGVSGRLRLTGRGRLVVILALLTIMLAVFTLGRVSGSLASAVDRPHEQAIVTVHAGDSLWSIATRAVPDEDPRRTVAEIRRLNDLDGSLVRVGQQLRVPQ